VDDSEFLDQIRGATTDAVRWAFLATVEVLRVNRASLLLRDGDEQVLRPVAYVGIEPETAAEIEVLLGEGLAGLAAERNMTLYGEVNGTKYIIVPIAWADRVAGVLNLTERREANDFGEHELASARAMAEHIAYLVSHADSHSIDTRSGLPARIPFMDALEREIERGRRVGSTFTLALVRIPDLPYLIDTLGEARVSEGLRDIGQSLESTCRRYDIVGHVEPDTFAFLFPSTDSITHDTMSRFVDVVTGRLETLTPGRRRRVEVGIVRYPLDGAAARELLGIARRLCDNSSATGPEPSRAAWTPPRS
jgi:GGDEF domain-containing protein